MAVSQAFLTAFEDHRAGRFADAERGYRAVLAKEPKNADAWHLLGLIAQQHGDLKNAAALIEKALQISGPNGDFLANLGVTYEAQGRSADAVRVLENAIKIVPRAFNAHLALGNALKSLGRFDDAIARYRAAQALEPKNPSTHNNIGTILQSLGRLDEAAAAFQQAVQLQPQHGPAHYNLGMVLKALGRANEAADCFRQTMTLLPEFFDAQLQLAVVLQDKQLLEQVVARARNAGNTTPNDTTVGNFAAALNELALLHKRAGRLDVAAELFDSVIARRANNPVFRSNLGNALVELDRAEEAEPHLREAVRLAPQLPETHFNLGNALKALGRVDEAIASYSQALAMRPGFTKVRINLGLLLSSAGRYDEARQNYDEGLRTDPQSAELFDGQGVLLQSLGRVEEGLESFLQALRINPDLPDAHRNAGLAYLTTGNFAEGWREYEWRWRCDPRLDDGRRFTVPAWQGERATDGIVVWGEQGVGDRLLYASMIPDLQAQGHRVVMETDARLCTLFERSFPGVTAVPKDDPPYPETIEGIDRQSALASLGRYLRPDAASFPQRESYLRAEPARVATYKAYLDTRGGGPVVGISWGSQNPKFGKHKTLELAAWAPLLKTPGVRFVDLQYGDTAHERAAVESALGVSLIHVPDLDLRDDIDGAAALTAACDLVISISNTAVHLAAGLGVPTWVLVPAAAGNLWYWMRGTQRTPWYPSAVIIRQKTLGQWDDVMQEVKTRFDRYLEKPAANPR